MRICNQYSSTRLVLEYSDDEEASWQDAWVATDLPYGVLKPYEWTMPPATANKGVLLRFRSLTAAVALDDLVSVWSSRLLVSMECWLLQCASAPACEP